MKIRVVYNTRLVWPGAIAWVFYPFMLFRQPKHKVTDKLFRHELEHVYQVQRLGWWRFYTSYIREWWRDGYYQNMFEVMANNAEDTPLTAAERRLKDE